MRRLGIGLVVVLLFSGAQAFAQQPPTRATSSPKAAARPGDKGVTSPKILKEVKPQYTADAMRAKIQGLVVLECIVEADGSVSDVKVVKSLDKEHGLDDEAVRAAKQWRFKPGMKKGKPVPVAVMLELTFTLRDGAPKK